MYVYIGLTTVLNELLKYDIGNMIIQLPLFKEAIFIAF